MVDALEIGYAIKDRRAELGVTQAQLAEAAGVSKRCLWSLELGQNPGVQLDKLTAVLGALGLELELTVGNPSDEPQAEQFESDSGRREFVGAQGVEGRYRACVEYPGALAREE